MPSQEPLETFMNTLTDNITSFNMKMTIFGESEKPINNPSNDFSMGQYVVSG